MTRKISRARLLQHGKYPPEVINRYARAQKYLPKMAISTFAKLYMSVEPISAESKADYCPRIGHSEKLEVHKGIMQQITVDSLANLLNRKPRAQCDVFMQNNDHLHALLSTKIKNHPLCPNTMEFYSEVLHRNDPVQFHGQLVNGIVTAMQNGWDTFCGSERQWAYLDAAKFRKFFSKRVKEYTNLHESGEIEVSCSMPAAEPISTPSKQERPAAVPIDELYDDIDEADMYSDEEDDDDDDDDDGDGSDYDDSNALLTDEGELGDAYSDDEFATSSSDGAVEISEVIADFPAEESTRVNNPLRHVARDKGRYRPDLLAIDEEELDDNYSDESSGEEVIAAPQHAKLEPVIETKAPRARPNLEPISETVDRVVRQRPTLVPVETERKRVSDRGTRPAVIESDKLKGEVMPASSARPTSLVAIGAERRKRDTQTSTLKPYAPPVENRARPKLLPVESEKPVRTSSRLVPIAKHIEAASVKPVRKMPTMIRKQESTNEEAFVSVKQTLRWLETYLDTDGHRLSQELVFFAPTNGQATLITKRAEDLGKQISVKPLVEAHLCEHGSSASIDGAELTSVAGNRIELGQNGKIISPALKSPWVDEVGIRDIAGFRVHVYSHNNLIVPKRT